MSNKFNNIKEIGGFLDNIVGSAMSAWGGFTKLFLVLLPVIFILWIVMAGYCEYVGHPACFHAGFTE